MPTLTDLHRDYGATLASDGIPLHYGDLAAEYDAALTGAILLDRSHEGRVELHGESRYDILNRMSTNKMVDMGADEGRATIFTNSNGRILERIVAYNRDNRLLMLTQPGRNSAFVPFLQRNIFFNDKARIVDMTSHTRQFALHGEQAQAIITALNVAPDVQSASQPPLYGSTISINGATVYAVQRKALIGQHWAFIVANQQAEDVYRAIMQAGADYGLKPAGSLTFNTLRIRAGQPAGRELSTDYIPLEVGLWDDVHFDKGCYTGQEIIARMESRSRLAKTIVAIDMATLVEAPAIIRHNERQIGQLTSSATAPDGTIFALGIIKTAQAQPNTPVTIGEAHISGTILRRVGEQPPYLQPELDAETNS